MQTQINTNAKGIKKLLAHYEGQINVMPISIFHQGAILRHAPKGVEVQFRNSGDVWEREMSFLDDKEYFPGRFVVVVKDDHVTQWNLAKDVKNVLA